MAIFLAAKKIKIPGHIAAELNEIQKLVGQIALSVHVLGYVNADEGGV